MRRRALSLAWRGIKPINLTVAVPQLHTVTINKLLGTMTRSLLVFANQVDTASHVALFIDDVSSEFQHPPERPCHFFPMHCRAVQSCESSLPV